MTVVYLSLWAPAWCMLWILFNWKQPFPWPWKRNAVLNWLCLFKSWSHLIMKHNSDALYCGECFNFRRPAPSVKSLTLLNRLVNRKRIKGSRRLSVSRKLRPVILFSTVAAAVLVSRAVHSCRGNEWRLWWEHILIEKCKIQWWIQAPQSPTFQVFPDYALISKVEFYHCHIKQQSFETYSTER